MSLISPLKSMSFAHGSEWYELSDQYDASVSGWSGNYESPPRDASSPADSWGCRFPGRRTDCPRS